MVDQQAAADKQRIADRFGFQAVAMAENARASAFCVIGHQHRRESGDADS